jgi:diguanylate cyclase (GGDEF)-like protein/PAS domain S-box-containing protein
VPAFFLDLDGFKGVNDTLGHAAGDKLLQTVAMRIEGVLRAGDTVGRLGGDEFVILLDPATLTVSPEVVAERVLAAVREPIDLAGGRDEPISITASIGLAMGPHASPDALLRAADLALYRAKAGGRDRFAQLESSHEIVGEPTGIADPSVRCLTLDTSGVHRQGLSEHALRTIVDRSFELLMVVDGDRTVRWANAAFERVLGFPPDSLIGGNISRLFHPDDLPALIEMIRQLDAGPGAAGTLDARMRTADSSWHVMEAVATNMFDDAAIHGLVVSLRDVTERRQVDALLGRAYTAA